MGVDRAADGRRGQTTLLFTLNHVCLQSDQLFIAVTRTHRKHQSDKVKVNVNGSWTCSDAPVETSSGGVILTGQKRKKFDALCCIGHLGGGTGRAAAAE